MRWGATPPGTSAWRIPICGRALFPLWPKPTATARYWKNARFVPFYVVSGELDGGKFGKNAGLGGNLDHYLEGGFDTTVVEFRAGARRLL